MAESAIEWTDATWNPVSGCDRVSPGCANCYALTLAKRLKAMGQPGYQRDGDPRTSGPGFGVTLHPHKLDEPLRWRKPRRVFVNSMSDLFHEDVPFWFIGQVFNRMGRAPQHTFQVLTKRPERALAWATASQYAGRGATKHPLPNVWLGVSIENARYTWRADVLREIPAAVRFISAEPLLGSLYEGSHDGRRKGTDADQRSLLLGDAEAVSVSRAAALGSRPELEDPPRSGDEVGAQLQARGRAPLDLTGIDWVIIGGESGPKARPFHLEHAREIIDSCSLRCDCGTTSILISGCRCERPAVFVKQLGARPVVRRAVVAGEAGVYRADLDAIEIDLRDRKGGDWDEWPADLRIREFPTTRGGTA